MHDTQTLTDLPVNGTLSRFDHSSVPSLAFVGKNLVVNRQAKLRCLTKLLYSPVRLLSITV
jgi:hypothetical protein